MGHILIFIGCVILAVILATAWHIRRIIKDYEMVTGKKGYRLTYDPKCNCPDQKPTQQDYEAVKSDWEAIGKDFETVLGERRDEQ
jgi:hypothetical protein